MTLPQGFLDLRSLLQINKKFIENKISIDERDLQKSANENEIKSLRKELDEVEQYKENY